MNILGLRPLILCLGDRYHSLRVGGEEHPRQAADRRPVGRRVKLFNQPDEVTRDATKHPLRVDGCHACN